MDLKIFFKKVNAVLKQNQCRYALAGGFVASLYRNEPRATNDLDFLLVADVPNKNVEELAQKIIKDFKMTPHLIRQADLEGGPLFAIKKKNTPIWMIVGRKKNDAQQMGLDFILPSMPWFFEVLNRAENNPVDFGFGPIPCLTVEDVLLTKFFAYQNRSDRFKDLDDLKSVFLAKHDLDLPYLAGQMKQMSIKVPKQLHEFMPKTLLKITKGSVKKH